MTLEELLVKHQISLVPNGAGGRRRFGGEMGDGEGWWIAEQNGLMSPSEEGRTPMEAVMNCIAAIEKLSMNSESE